MLQREREREASQRFCIVIIKVVRVSLPKWKWYFNERAPNIKKKKTSKEKVDWMARKRKGKMWKEKGETDGMPSRLMFQTMIGPSSSHQLLNGKSVLFSLGWKLKEGRILSWPPSCMWRPSNYSCGWHVISWMHTIQLKRRDDVIHIRFSLSPKGEKKKKENCCRLRSEAND